MEVVVYSEKLSGAQLLQSEKDALETMETKCQLGATKLDKAATTADESDRMAKVLQNQASDDGKKMVLLTDQLEEELKVVANNLKSWEVSEDKGT